MCLLFFAGVIMMCLFDVIMHRITHIIMNTIMHSKHMCTHSVTASMMRVMRSLCNYAW